MGMAELPVPYERLLEQIAVAGELLDRLRGEPDTPKVRFAIARLEDAQSAMLRALARCGVGDARVLDN
jgi:hypothetical protein